MKITVAKLFDIASIVDQAIAQALTGFIAHVNGALEQTFSVLQNGITLKENVNCEIITLSGVISGVSTVVETKKVPSQIDLILAGKVIGTASGTTDGCRSIQWESDSNSKLVITPTFESLSATRFNLTIFIIYK